MTLGPVFFAIFAIFAIFAKFANLQSANVKFTAT
jgi:hypothetical protein